MRWNRSIAHVALLSACLTMILSACGTTTITATTPATVAPTATATTDATPTARATALPTAPSAVITSGLPSGCSYLSGMSLTRVGALGISQVAMALNYPDWTIPPGTPNQPMKLSTSATGAPAQGSVAVGSHGTTDGYFAFSVCNLSPSQSYTLQSVSVRVASFKPYSGALSVWNACNDGSYNAKTQSAMSGGCGGGYGANEYLQAAFPGDAAVGDSVIAQVVSTSSAGPNDPSPFPRLPLSLAPGRSVSMALTLTVPTTPGTYTFAFGLALNASAPTYFSTSSPTLYAPITTHWSGQNCTAPAMKSQIPAATQPTYYICPPAQ